MDKMVAIDWLPLVYWVIDQKLSCSVYSIAACKVEGEAGIEA